MTRVGWSGEALLVEGLEGNEYRWAQICEAPEGRVRGLVFPAWLKTGQLWNRSGMLSWGLGQILLVCPIPRKSCGHPLAPEGTVTAHTITSHCHAPCCCHAHGRLSGKRQSKGGVCAQRAHSMHSAHITGGNWGFLQPMTIFLPP